jgi:anti-anti-sigma factor
VERPILRLSTSRAGDTATVSAAGEIDLHTAAGLEAEAVRALDQGPARLILDLAEVTFCDSQGLAVLVRLDRLARERGSHLTIVNATRIVARVMRITGLDTALDVVEQQPDSTP